MSMRERRHSIPALFLAAVSGALLLTACAEDDRTYYMTPDVFELQFGGNAGEVLTLHVQATVSDGETKLPYDLSKDGNSLVVSCRTDISWLDVKTAGNTITFTNLVDHHTHDQISCYLNITDAKGKMVPSNVWVKSGNLPPIPVPGFVDPVTWAAKDMINRIADKDGDGEVSFAEADAVTELTLEAAGLTDADFVRHFRNLTKLNLSGNGISDMSPLCGLTKLKELRLSGNAISDVSALSGLKKMEILDLSDNDIVNADVVSQLPALHKLDLRGNMRLASFDITGCTHFFEQLDFEVTENLRYRMFDTQLVCGESDINLEHADFVEDTRQSTDFSRHRRVVKLREHTVGPGRPVIIVGEGWLDIDLENGSFERAVNFLLKWLMDKNMGFRETLELEDIYYIEQVSESRFVTYPGCEMRLEDTGWRGKKHSTSIHSRVFIQDNPPLGLLSTAQNEYFGISKEYLEGNVDVPIGTEAVCKYVEKRTEFQKWVAENYIPETKNRNEPDAGSTLCHYYCIRLSTPCFLEHDDAEDYQGPIEKPLVFGQEVNSYRNHGYYAFRQEGMFYHSYLWKNGQPNSLPSGKHIRNR